MTATTQLRYVSLDERIDASVRVANLFAKIPQGAPGCQHLYELADRIPADAPFCTAEYWWPFASAVIATAHNMRLISDAERDEVLDLAFHAAHGHRIPRRASVFAQDPHDGRWLDARVVDHLPDGRYVVHVPSLHWAFPVDQTRIRRLRPAR